MNNLDHELNLLYEDMSTIGMRVNFTRNKKLQKEAPDIERTIIKLIYKIDDDGRLLGLLFSWLETHGKHLIADKFFKEYNLAKKFLGESVWFSAICIYMSHKKDIRFKKGIKKLKNYHHLGNRDQNNLIKLKGAVKIFEEIGILVPLSSFRIRVQDVFTQEELITCNQQYRNRYLFGANWRAEIITSIQRGAKNPNQVSKILGLARSRVCIVFKEYMMVKDFV